MFVCPFACLFARLFYLFVVFVWLYVCFACCFVAFVYFFSVIAHEISVVVRRTPLSSHVSCAASRPIQERCEVEGTADLQRGVVGV